MYELKTDNWTASAQQNTFVWIRCFECGAEWTICLPLLFKLPQISVFLMFVFNSIIRFQKKFCWLNLEVEMILNKIWETHKIHTDNSHQCNVIFKRDQNWIHYIFRSIKIEADVIIKPFNKTTETNATGIGQELCDNIERIKTLGNYTISKHQTLMEIIEIGNLSHS